MFTLTKFTIEPARCKISYACTSVARVDGNASKIECSDFVFDGLYDGDAGDGILTFSADQTDYVSETYPPG